MYLDSSKEPSPLMNIDVQGIVLRIFDMADLQGISGVVSNVFASLKAVGKYMGSNKKTV